MIDKYEYLDADGNTLWGQIFRFQARNGSYAEGANWAGDCCDVGSRVPAIFVSKMFNGVNRLQVSSAIFNDEKPGPITGGFGNYIFEFYGSQAPSTGEWATITISQTPSPSQWVNN